jgi:hypothetical protein
MFGTRPNPSFDWDVAVAEGRLDVIQMRRVAASENFYINWIKYLKI